MAIGHASHRMGQLMKRNPDQQVRIDVGGEGSAAVVGGGAVRTDQSEQLQLRIPDRDLRLPLDRRARGNALKLVSPGAALAIRSALTVE